MSRKIVIFQGHPDNSEHRLCHALADAYQRGALEAGHQVRVIDIAGIDFPLLRSQDDFEHRAAPPALVESQDAIRWADHLVFVFPLWLGTMPALVKAFLEQVFRPGFSFSYAKKGTTKSLLIGRSARLVVTMGMPVMLYRMYFLSHGLRGMERNILRFVGIKPVRESLFGLVDTVSDTTREGWITEMERLGKRGV